MEYYVPSLSRIIGVFNTKTPYNNFKKNLEIGMNNAKIVSNFIRENDIAYLGTQELIKPYQETIARYLSEYTVYGGYCFEKAQLIPGIKNYNESNAIISKYPIDVCQSYTIHLPSMPTVGDIKQSKSNILLKLQPTTMTVIVSPCEKVIHVNTHLHDDLCEKRAQQEQFITKKIYELKQKYPNYAIILTGNFNALNDSANFQNFVSKMQLLGFTLVPIMERTDSKQTENIATNQIFINQYMALEDCTVIKEGEITETSDHYPVLAKVKLKH